MFGGARDSDEDPVVAALRETGEESTLDTGLVRVRGVMHEDHDGWAYDTVIGDFGDLAELRRWLRSRGRPRTRGGCRSARSPT